MFKLVVLSALLAVVAAKPSYLVAPAVHSYVAAPAIYAPAAVSHTSRVDYRAAPVHAAYVAPYAAYSHGWAAPLAAPLALAPKTPAVVLGPHGVPLDTAAVVADRAYHYAVKANSHHYIHKRSAIAPLAYSSVYAAPAIVAAPAAVSHQSRVDVIKSAPVVAAYAAPVLSHYAAPVVSHYAAAPVVSHYAPWSTSTYWGKAAGAYGHYW